MKKNFWSILFLISLVFTFVGNGLAAVPDEGPFHWKKSTNGNTLSWWSAYTGLGAVAYDLVQDEEYFFRNSTNKIELSYH
ncbi:MAG: hypothetical protein ACH0QD_10745 [Tepidibacillus sp.]